MKIFEWQKTFSEGHEIVDKLDLCESSIHHSQLRQYRKNEGIFFRKFGVDITEGKICQYLLWISKKYFMDRFSTLRLKRVIARLVPQKLNF